MIKQLHKYLQCRDALRLQVKARGRFEVQG